MARGKYRDWLESDKLTLLEGWARDGATDEIIARKIGINPCTLYDWKKKYPKIAKALKKGKEVVDIDVENALLKNARGYSYDEIIRERVFNRQTGEYELQITKVITKHVKADTTAQIFWLKNRRPDMWRDRQDISVDKSIPVVISGGEDLED